MDYTAGASLTESVTACRDALVTLARLGRSADADELLTEAEQRASYDAIAADTSRTDAWKLQRYAAAYSSVMSTLARKLTSAADSASSRYKIDAETVFGIRGLPGDPGFLIVSLRDAQDRIEGEHDSIKLQRLLDKAVLNGDDIRARDRRKRRPQRRRRHRRRLQGRLPRLSGGHRPTLERRHSWHNDAGRHHDVAPRRAQTLCPRLQDGLRDRFYRRGPDHRRQ